MYIHLSCLRQKCFMVITVAHFSRTSVILKVSCHSGSNCYFTESDCCLQCDKWPVTMVWIHLLRRRLIDNHVFIDPTWYTCCGKICKRNLHQSHQGHHDLNCIPGQKLGILCICHHYAAATTAASEISCVRSTARSLHLIFKFRSHVSCTKV